MREHEKFYFSIKTLLQEYSLERYSATSLKTVNLTFEKFPFYVRKVSVLRSKSFRFTFEKFPFYVRKVSIQWKTFERILKESKPS